MSEELTKEMEQVDEVEEATAKPTGVKAKEPGASNPSSVKLKQEDENMQKAKTSSKSSEPKATKGTVKPVSVESKEDEEDKESVEEAQAKSESDEEEEKEVKEETPSTPKLKSEIMQGLVDHIKGLKKEDLAKLYGAHVLGETPKEDEGYEEEEEDEEASKIKKEDIDQVVDALDVSGDVEALVDGEELSEDFKTKAATIFESAIKSKVRTELEKIHQANEESSKKVAEETMSSVVEKVDDYLSYVVEQWMSENELAIERGLKGEIAEDFISGLKGLFEDHYIDVPDEKYDILEANLTKIEELEDKLNKQMEENVQLRKAKGELVKESMIADIADGMTDTETEKFQSLVDDVEFSDEDSYKEKLQTIKESYFGDKEVKAQDETLTEETKSEEDAPKVSGEMAQYMTAISKDNKRAQK